MRIAGEILILVGLGIAVGTALLHKVAVDQLVVSSGQPDPATLAKIMQLPFQGAIVAAPIGSVGVILIAISLLTARRAEDTPNHRLHSTGDSRGVQ